jgi:hypothetical protein
MAKYSMTWQGTTAVVVADTNAYTDAGYEGFLQGGSATMRLVVSEVYIGGEDTASTVNTIVLARDSTVGATAISGNKNAVLDASNTAPGTVAVFGNTSTTKPQRSSTLHLLQLSMNSFGGIVRWVAAPGNEITVVTATQPLGEISISHVAGTGKTSGHIIYEVV